MGYSPVYSVQFLLWTDAAPNTTYEVPMGATAVIRQLSSYVGAGSNVWTCSIQNDDSAPAVVIGGAVLAAALGFSNSEGRWVVPGGGFISLYVQEIAVNTSIYVGGYLLPNSLP